MPQFEKLFSEDEVFHEMDEDWTEEELLAKSGLFRFSKVTEKLEINGRSFRQFLGRIGDKDKVREQYGVVQGGWWRINMKEFKEVAPEIQKRFPARHLKPARPEMEPDRYKEVPEDIERTEFFKLQGVYRLRQVMDTGYLPYNYNEVYTRIRKDGVMLEREECGCWRGRRFILVDMVPFLTWILAQFRGISVAEARSLTD